MSVLSGESLERYKRFSKVVSSTVRFVSLIARNYIENSLIVQFKGIGSYKKLLPARTAGAVPGWAISFSCP